MRTLGISLKLKKTKVKKKGIPCGPAVRTCCFHSWGQGSVSGWGNKTHKLRTKEDFLKDIYIYIYIGKKPEE